MAALQGKPKELQEVLVIQALSSVYTFPNLFLLGWHGRICKHNGLACRMELISRVLALIALGQL